MSESVVGKLSVVITADSKGVETGLKATRGALKLTGKKLRSQINQWGKWAIAASAAAATAGAALVTHNLKAIRELRNLSERAGVTVKDFQQMSFAASKYGIEQDKLSDILLDFNDKLGDVTGTKGGAMIDFFEQIAPKVGVTLEQFQKLSSKDGLQLYVDSLEKANVSQADMTFYMEAIASDSTNLLPLLKDNGAAMKDLAQQAADLGIGLSKVQVDRAIEAQEQLDKISAVISNDMMIAVAELSPLIGVLAKEFLNVSNSSQGMLTNTFDGFKKVARGGAVFADGLHGLQVIFEGLKAGAAFMTLGMAAGFEGIVKILMSVSNGLVKGIMWPIKKIAELMAPFSDSAAQALKMFGKLEEKLLLKMPQGIKDFTLAQAALADSAVKSLKEMAMTPLPSQNLEAWLVEVEEKVNKAKEIIASTTKTQTDDPEKNGKANRADRIRQENESILEALLEQGDLIATTQLDQLAREKEVLDQALADKKISLEDYSNAEIALARKTEQAKNQILVSGLDAAVQALQVGGKKTAKIAKAIAIASAIVKGKQAAVDAWQAGMATGNPILAPIYAAASLASTGAIIRSISSGGKSASVSGGGMSSAGSQSAPAQQQAPAAPQTSRNISINMTGGSMWSTDAVRELIGQINEQTGDGVQLTFG